MATPNAHARGTPGPTRPNGHELAVNPPGALARPAAAGSPPKEAPPPPRSVHTVNFSTILREVGISVLIMPATCGDFSVPRPGLSSLLPFPPAMLA
jgi:hypothetical protein